MGKKEKEKERRGSTHLLVICVAVDGGRWLEFMLLRVPGPLIDPPRMSSLSASVATNQELYLPMMTLSFAPFYVGCYSARRRTWIEKKCSPHLPLHCCQVVIGRMH